MIADSPGVEEIDGKGGGADFALTEQNADQVLQMINQINRR